MTEDHYILDKDLVGSLYLMDFFKKKLPNQRTFFNSFEDFGFIWIRDGVLSSSRGYLSKI